MAELINRRGGIAIGAPALSEQPDIDPAAIARLIDAWAERPAKVAIFQTGVGTRALFATTDGLGATPQFIELLANTHVVVRGPKPTAALRQRNVRIDHHATEPFTTSQVLEAIAAIEITGETVVVQRYGDVNAGLNEALTARGATVIEVPTYRWALPTDTTQLTRLMDALDRSELDAVLFTSASQVQNLFAFAQRGNRETRLRTALNATLIASIGPVCSHALRERGVGVGLEAQPPKLGPMLEALEAALSAAGQT